MVDLYCAVLLNHCLKGKQYINNKFNEISICNRMRPSKIKDKFSRVFSKFSQFKIRFSFQDAYKMQMARSRAQPIKCE